MIMNSFICMLFVREDLSQWVKCKNTPWFFIPFSHVIWWQLLKIIILNVNQHNIQRNDKVELIMTKFRNCCGMPLVHGVINDTHIYIAKLKSPFQEDYYHFKTSGYSMVAQMMVDIGKCLLMFLWHFQWHALGLVKW